ncbi:MAG: SciE type virulence protein [Alphaproteobacteria bacterium]|nr:SciE type virulence protein [Alphaproteobacteria bacterium]
MTDSALSRFQTGDLAQAVQAALAEVKRRPTDMAARLTLGEMLCFADDIERADIHFEAAQRLAGDDNARPLLLRNLLRAETSRRHVFAGGGLPEFLAEPTVFMRAALRALAGDHAAPIGDPDQPPLRVTCDGATADGFRDIDDVTAEIIEVLTATGRYYWVSPRDLTMLAFQPPKRPCDLLWRRARIVGADGANGEVFIPVLYPTRAPQGSDALRLGFETDWIAEPGHPVRGVGQRLMLIGDEAKGVMEIGTLAFSLATPA